MDKVLLELQEYPERLYQMFNEIVENINDIIHTYSEKNGPMEEVTVRVKINSEGGRGKGLDERMEKFCCHAGLKGKVACKNHIFILLAVLEPRVEYCSQEFF